MRKFAWLASLFLLLAATSGHRTAEERGAYSSDQGRIQVARAPVPSSLVEDVFIKGNCNNVSNVRAIGMPMGIGTFENGEDIIDMDRGIILSTGRVESARGPNHRTDESTAFFDENGDPDLNIMSDTNVKDVVGLEFDFVPLDSMVTFNYVFASEEYCEFVGSIFNDVFGFFVSGPGIQGEFSLGSENLAIIPGTDDFVAINSVNHLLNSRYYIGNERRADAIRCEISENNGEFHQEIQYDGFTKKLQAELKLIPCETYHIRLVIADVGDFFYDSAVFLEAESFEIGGDVVISAGTDDGTDEVFEGCSGGYFTFERTDLSNLNHRIQVDFLVAEESTAIPGEDFAMLPSSIVIPSGEESVRLPIEGILDDLREPPESIMLELDYPCSCDTDTARLFLVDPPPFAVEVEDLNLCRESRENLVPEIGGGVADFSYRWNTGDSSRAVSVSGGDAGTYYLTVTDACGQEAFASAQVNTVAAPSGTISGSAMICEGDTAHFEVLLDGQAPWSFDHYVNGNFVRRVENITGSAYQLAVGRGGIHRMSGLTDKYCPGSSSGYAEVDLTEIDIRFETEQISCHGGSDGQVSAFPSGGIPPYSFVWEGGLGEADVLEDIAAGIYTLRVTDAQGCEKLAEVEVGQAEPLTGIRFDCTDLASGNLDLTAGGGRPPYQYSIDGAPFRDETVLRRLEAGKTYQITIRDQADCRLQQAFTMPAASAKMVDIPSQVELDLGEKYQLQPELYIPASLLREISWQPSDQLSCSDCLRPVITAHYTQGYTLHVTDAFGCTDASSLMVEVRKKPTLFIPNAFSPNGDGINDFFFPNLRDEQVSRVLSFRIYNRWGNLVFEALDFDPGHSAGRWDGRLNGSLLNTGVFVYRIELELVNGTFAEYSGDVALIR